MGYVGTLGLGELIWFPKASYRVIRDSIVGQHLRVFYDDQGKVQKIELDGEYKWSSQEYREKQYAAGQK